MPENTLNSATSPYLLQHKDNPVHWQVWGPEALSLAKQLDRPILLSIGYAACHWCHVMAHESFEDEMIAGVMNSLFVNVKVDREERPDVDSIYMSALHLLGAQGGWPLTMFLTPAGAPFWGGTYFPPRARHGQPGFPDVLQAVHRAYREQPDLVQNNSTALREALQSMTQGLPPESLALDLADKLAPRIAQHVDPLNGGLRGAPKFPQAALLELLWRAYLRGGPSDLAHAVTVSLDHMCQGGIYDHLGGGFARYSVDERWLVPHFEKMLYDNAVLVELLSVAWRETRHPLYAARVRETVEFILREMRGPEGGFAASYDADSEGEEGRYYVWSIGEIVSVLGRESLAFCGAYDVTEEGNWEGQNILNRLGALEDFNDETEARFARARAMLLEVRAQRVPPGFDDKILSDWNGLMIAALAQAALSFGRADWLAAAEDAFAQVLRLLSFTQDGALRLYQSYRADRAQHAAVADAYANLARAALILEEATGRDTYLRTAEALTASLDRYFWDQVLGGYYYTASDAEALITRSRFAHDHPLPNANGVMIEVSSRLYHRTGDEHHRARIESIVTAFSGEIDKNGVPHATILNAMSFHHAVRQIVIRGSRDAADTRALMSVAFALATPEKMIAVIGPDEPLPPSHPAAQTQMVGGRATAYLCRGTQCSLPIQEPADLSRAAF